MAKDSTVPGLASDNWPNMPKVTRADLRTNTVSVPVKGGLKVVNSIPKAQIKRGEGHPPGGSRKSTGSEPYK